MPVERQFRSEERFDFFGEFSQGVNTGVAPLILPRNQLANGSNITVRGTYVRPRSYYRKMEFNFGGDTDLQSAVESVGLFQGATYFRPDSGIESLVASLAGRLFQFRISGNVATVSERTIPGNPNPPGQLQAWLWQAEKWIIVNDGVSLPLFMTDSTTVRSNGQGFTPQSNTLAATYTVPSPGSFATVAFTGVAGLSVGSIVTLPQIGQGVVTAIAGLNVDILNTSFGPIGTVVPAATNVAWNSANPTPQLPVGRMGAYGRGRIWMALADGKQFVASDLVGGSSGTAGENYRDAILNITENLYLRGGGYFTVPGNLGDIRAMKFAATLDASLGQGPLQVFTPEAVFSCNAPVNRLEWQDIQNPILTESLISNGALGQWSTVLANGDFLFRSVDGSRSLILARREFATWGNVPISREVDRRLSADSVDLLRFTSSIVFDNRHLLTTAPVLFEKGVYFRALVPLNFDPISTLRGKAPAVYDSLMWTGLNVFQLLTGSFSNEDRAFAFTWNTQTEKLELWEILKTAAHAIRDNDAVRVVQAFETPVLFNQPGEKQYQRLLDGELQVDEMQGRVDFQVWWKPDQWPCWVPWFQWTQCATVDDDGKVQFRPHMGFGEPPSAPCDEVNNRPLREGYTFQFKFIITGHCRVIGARFRAVTVPEPKFAPQCCPDVALVPKLLPKKPGPTQVPAILAESPDDAALISEGGGAILQE